MYDENTKRKLEQIEKRITQLERQKQSILNRENDKKRKARTKRLIQIGAISIKYLNCPNDIEPIEFEEQIKQLTCRAPNRPKSFS